LVQKFGKALSIVLWAVVVYTALLQAFYLAYVPTVSSIQQAALAAECVAEVIIAYCIARAWDAIRSERPSNA
jgi:hypothetical protein